MTTEEKFNAAVNVIRSLPKNGSYQPSYDLMLRFYAYFKQATQGSCTGSRPAFWDVKERAKYDAWKRLGEMPKTDAMTKYVEELHTIVETMSYTDNVANFLEAPTNELDNVKLADLELIAGDVMERVRSQPNSPFSSREASPQRIKSSVGSSLHSSPSLKDSDFSDDEYIDTIEHIEPKKTLVNGSIHKDALTNGISQKEQLSKPKSKVANNTKNLEIIQETLRAVQSLQTDIDSLKRVIQDMQLNFNRQLQLQQAKRNTLFGNLSPQFIAFIITWPFVANFIMNKYLVRK